MWRLAVYPAQSSVIAPPTSGEWRPVLMTHVGAVVAILWESGRGTEYNLQS